jgi:hypothetical protein
MSTVSAVTKIVGAATLIFLGYAFLAALPDADRYIECSPAMNRERTPMPYASLRRNNPFASAGRYR